MGIWQILLIGLYCLSLGVNAGLHGKPKEGNHSFWTSLMSAIITMFILYKGGFFS